MAALFNTKAAFVLIGGITIFLAGLAAGNTVGTANTTIKERKLCKEATDQLVAEHTRQIVALNDSIEAYKTNLSDARNSALDRARQIEQQRNSLRLVEGQLRNNQSPIIVREINENCKASDIVVNTDNADRLRNCLASDDPAKCANSNNTAQ